MITSSETLPKKILIVGGGTAGWMAANLMAACWMERGFDISLIESPDIGIIGVGEGSTPQLKSFFDFLGIQESEWMAACNATYKNGIRFNGWSSMPGCESYFHPFESELDKQTQAVFFQQCDLRRNQINAFTNPTRFYVSAKLAERKLKPIAPTNFPVKMGYGYHFDSGLLGVFLRDKAKSRGVQHISAKVDKTQLNAAGEIASVHTADGETLSADLFVDCTGFSGLLLQKTLQVPFIKFSENLLNDSAIAMPSVQEPQVATQTVSTAMKYGWAWEIPLVNRKGNGYVYSSAFCSPDQAEFELRTKLGLLDADVQARHLSMNVGRVEQHWAKNCLAVGLSQGFIEPLEATALHIVQETLQGFIDAWELGDFTHINQEKFNARINNRFEGVRDYIVAHYVCNSRDDTDYWRANRRHDALSNNLKAVIETWVSGGDMASVLKARGMDKYYLPMSWYALLSGYGIYPSVAPVSVLNFSETNLADVDDFIAACCLHFSP
jgi:hypothetical protein